MQSYIEMILILTQVIDRLGIRLLVAQTRLLLNRPFLTRALRENPNDPSFSKTGTTFVALYGSAQVIVQLVKQLVIYHPSLIVRWQVLLLLVFFVLKLPQVVLLVPCLLLGRLPVS